MKFYEHKSRFSLGEISPGLCYRVDTEIPNKGLAYLKNGLISASAGLTNFPKLEKINTIDMNTTVNSFRIFKYKINKKDTTLNGYLFMYTEKKLIILRMDNFQKVTEISSSYTTNDIKNLSIAQFENSVISCVANKAPVMIRVDETNHTFTVVDYWNSIVNPPVKKVESEYLYTGEDKQVFEWYKEGSKVVFESTLTTAVYKPTFVTELREGTVSIYGGDFKIEKIENPSGRQKLTTVQLTAPSGGIEIPNKDDPESVDKKINILDLVFSESLFNKGYPAVVTEFQGRVIFGNVAGNPTAIVASRVFDSLNFRQSLENNDGFTTFVTGNEVNTIKDFISYKSLLAITDKGIFSTQLNEALTPKTSSFYDQKLPRPKGLRYWCEADDAIYYADNSNRIYQIQDIGSDSAYKANEITTYANHLIDNVEDMYFFKIDKNNLIGVDTGTEGRAVSYNYEEGLLCWTRIEKLSGLNEYVNIDDNLYLFNVKGNNIDIYNYSKTEVEPLELKLPKTTLTQKINIDIPEFFKKAKFGDTRIIVFGNYDLEVNGISKRYALNEEIKGNIYSENPHLLEFTNSGRTELYVKQINNERIDIIGIYAQIKDFK